MKTYQIKEGKTSYIFDLSETENVSHSDMAPYTSAVSNFIEANFLPSFSYPEVYEFMVRQRDCKTEENQFGNLVFDYSFSVSFYESLALVTLIKNMSRDNLLVKQTNKPKTKQS